MDLLPTHLTTERLTLRQWSVDDGDPMAVDITESLEPLRPWMPWAADEPLSAEGRRSLIEGWLADWRQGGDTHFGAWRAGTIVGGCGLHRRAGISELEIGYWMHVDHLRRGYATEFTQALVVAAFQRADTEIVSVLHDTENVASGAIPRRLGFRAGDRRPAELPAPAGSGILQRWELTRESFEAR